MVRALRCEVVTATSAINILAMNIIQVRRSSIVLFVIEAPA